jgi:hypothetical protein
MESTISNRAVALLAGAAIAAAGTFAVATMAPQQAEAAAYKTAPSAVGRTGALPWKVKIGKTTYSYTAKYTKQGRLKKGSSVIKAVKKGKTRILVKNAPAGAQFVTNGKYLYYFGQAKKGHSPLYRLTVKNKAKKKVLSVSVAHPYVLTAAGSKVYYGFDSHVMGYDLKSHKKFSFGKHLDGNFARVSGKRIIVGGSATANNWVPLYSFNYNGKDRKQIAKTAYWSWQVKGSKVRYAVEKQHKGGWKSQSAMMKWYRGKIYRVYQCNNLGKHKKSVTGWVDSRKVEKVLNNR